MSRINLNVVATGDFSSVLSEINIMRQKVAELNAQIARAGGISDAQLASVRSAVSAYDSMVHSSGAFTRSLVDVQDQTAKFGRELQDGKLKVGQYFKTWREGAQNTQGQLRDLAKQQIALQQSIIRTDPFKSGKAFVDTPRQLDEVANKTALARKQQELYNLSLYKGGDALINWGKNTQWAGRQLTVGLTVPIAMFGQKAAQAFLAFDKELTRVVKVYGSGLTSASEATIAKIKQDVTSLSQQIAQQLGVPIEQTAAVAADLAATGLEGKQLLGATTEAVRLSVLGEIDRQEAVRATVSLQNVFKLSTKDLTESINFLNAVENQTSTGLQDIVDAIPKASPVVAQLGGDFKDVAVMMVAMKEAGVPAAESANAIKSAVGSLINPTQKASENLSKFGIDLSSIVQQNRDNLPQLFQVFQKELSKLSDLQRAQVIEQIFGKYQFARISALLENIGQQGSQTQKVFELMGASAAQTAQLANGELKQLTESASGRYQRALASFQAAIAPIGEKFVDFASKALNFFTGLAEFVENNPVLKNILSWGAAFVAVVGPIVMLGGVFANFIGYLVKGFAQLKNLKDGFKGFAAIATPSTIAAAKAGELFETSLVSQAEAANILKLAMKDLNRELSQYGGFAGRGGGPFGPGGGNGGRNPLYPSGYPRPPYSPKPTTVVTGPGGPKGDVIPAMLSAGEAILNADAVRNLTPAQVHAINNDPKLAAALNRLFGVYTKYNTETPTPYNPYTYNSEVINQKTGEVVRPASVIEGAGGRQSTQGVGYAPYYDIKSGGVGADIYHTESYASILRQLGIDVSTEEERKRARKTKEGRAIEGYSPPSGTISTKRSVPSKIQQFAGDIPQHYYEPSKEDLARLASAGIHIDEKLMKEAREKYIVSLANGNKKVEGQIREQMALMTEQDAKDWLGRTQTQSKATAAVLQEHLHNVLTGKETYNGATGKDAAKALEKEMRAAAATGSPAKIDKLVSDLKLDEKVKSRVAEVEKVYNDEVTKQLSSLPPAQRTPEAVSKAFQDAAKKVDANLDKGYIDRLKTFTKERIGGRALFKVISGISRSSTDTEFSGTVSGIKRDLNDSVKGLYGISGAKARGVEKAIDSYASAVNSASNIEDETKRNAAIKQATVDLRTSLSKLGIAAEHEVEQIDLMIRSATAQLASVAPGTALGQGLRTAAGAAPAPKVKRSGGGQVSGPGGSKSDSIPAMLSNGEYVVSADAVKKYGVGMLDSLNAKKLANGGMVAHYSQGSIGGIGAVDAPLLLPEGKSYGPMPAVGGTSPTKRVPISIDFSDAAQQGQEYLDFLDDVSKKSKEFKENNVKVSESLDNVEKTQTKTRGGLSKLKESMKGGGMASFGLSMGLGTVAAALSTSDNKAAKAAGSIAEFASMGAMFGPWGIAIGAAVGGLKALIDHVDEVSRINRNSMASSLSISKEAAAQFGIEVRDLSNIQLTELEKKSKGAAEAIKQLSEAYGQAGDQITQDFITKLKEADPTEAAQLLINKYRSDIIAGMDDPKSRIDIMALLKTAGKTELTFEINAKLDEMKFKSSKDALQSQLNDINVQFKDFGKFNADAFYNGVKDSMNAPDWVESLYASMMTSHRSLGQKITDDSAPIWQRVGAGIITTMLAATGDAQALTGLIPLEEINKQLDAAQPKFNEFAITIMNAFQTMPIKDFSDAMDTVFGTWNNVSATQAKNTEDQIKGAMAQREFNSTIDEMAKKSPMLAGELKKLANETGVTYKDALVAGQLAAAGLITNLDDLRTAARNPVYARFILEKDTYEKTIDAAAKEANKKIGEPIPIKAPVHLEMVDDSADQQAIRDRYERASKGAERYYEKLSKRQDKIIERNRKLIDNINEERDARQKVAEIQQANLETAVKTVNLENEIAKAQAEGDMAKAAALKMQLKAEQTKAAAAQRENAIKGKEDQLIKAANNRIDAAEREKQRIEEVKKSVLESLAVREKAEIKALTAATKAENERRKAVNKTADANYELAKTSRTAARTSNAIFGDIATRLKQKLFTNPALAMKDSVIRKLRDEMIAAGYEPARIDRAIKGMLASSSAGAKTFMDGVGATLYNELYTNGIAAGLSPSEANRAANAAVTSIQTVLTDPKNKLSTDIQTKLATLAGEKGILVNPDGTISITAPLSPEATKILNELQENGALTKDPATGKYIIAGVAASQSISVDPKMIQDAESEDVRRLLTSDGKTISSTFKPTFSMTPTTSKALSGFAAATKDKNPKVTPIASGVSWGKINSLVAAGKDRKPTITPSADVTNANKWLNWAARPRTAMINSIAKYTYWTERETVNGKTTWSYFAHNNQTGATQKIDLATYNSQSANFARGGRVIGPGTKNSDSIMANLSNGEYVINAAAVDKFGVGLFDSLNSMDISKLSSIYNKKYLLDNALTTSSIGIDAKPENSMYNYNINVNVAGTNASADDIAQQVMNALKRRENMIGTRTKI